MKENHFFWNKIKKKYYPCLDFVVHLAYFIVFEVYVAAFYRRSQLRLDRAISKDLKREAIFSPKFKSTARSIQ